MVNPSVSVTEEPSVGTPTATGALQDPKPTVTVSPSSTVTPATPQEAVRAAAVTDDTKTLTIPVYDDKSVLGGGESYGIGIDCSIFDTYGADPANISGVLERHPNPGIRKMNGDMYYLVYDGESGIRVIYYLTEYNGLQSLCGFPVVLEGEPLCFADFASASIGLGSTLPDVVSVDRTARFYYHAYCEAGQVSEGTLSERAKAHLAYTTVHYLQDGILVIYYESMNENGDLIVTRMVYSDDYRMTDVLGRELDYSINPLDIPGRQ